MSLPARRGFSDWETPVDVTVVNAAYTAEKVEGASMVLGPASHQIAFGAGVSYGVPILRKTVLPYLVKMRAPQLWSVNDPVLVTLTVAVSAAFRGCLKTTGTHTYRCQFVVS